LTIPVTDVTLPDVSGYPRVVSVLAGAVALILVATSPAWAGSIKGPVRLAGSVDAKKLPVTVDHAVCGREKDSEELVLSADKGIRNAVVSLLNPPPGAKWKPLPSPQIDQQQCVFVPRVVVVPLGGTVEFLNGDRLLHNIRGVSEASAFNRTQPKGRTIPIVFKKSEILRIDCDLHPWMRAWVVVADHPFYAVTDAQGQFVLEDVPAGSYTLRIWHETLGAVTKEVSVGSGVTPITVEMTRK
jgi:hypothetical protein